MYPSLEEVKNIASSGKYRRIPVSRELYADRYTPVEVLQTLRGASRHCYLLESASQTESWGRYSFLGCHPTLELNLTDGVLTLRRTAEAGARTGAEEAGTGRTADADTSETIEVRKVTHPGEALREILKDYKSPVLEGLPPFTGGLVGYFSYDYIKYSEPKLNLTDAEQQDFRDMDLMLFDEVIAFDHYKQKIYLIAGVRTENMEESYREAEEKLAKLAELIRTGQKPEFRPLTLKSEIQAKFPKERYGQMVEKAKEYIREGDIFQVVLSNPMRARAEGSLFDTYRVLRASNPSP